MRAAEPVRIFLPAQGGKGWKSASAGLPALLSAAIFQKGRHAVLH